MSSRFYNKLFVNKHSEESGQTLLLGYKYNKKEVVLNKDKETYFHIPTFSETVTLLNSNLVENGAVGGPFPAASDRIFKNQENYGNYTPYGNSTTGSDGMWFCSWLYYDPIDKQNKWLDRFYDPGKFNYNQALDELVLSPSYEVSNPVFVDKPSELIFEQGVLYKYFRVGEGTYKKLVSSFAGLSSEHLLLSLTNWTTQSAVDISNNSYAVKTQTNTSYEQIVSTNKTKTRLIEDSINFNNSFSTNVYVDYDKNYNTENEFTWSFWVNSSDWKKSSFSQLVGNYTSKGEGISISLEDCTATPLVVIPETYYGHLLFLNEKGDNILDKSLQDSSARLCPNVYALDSENNLIVCELSGAGVMYKMDHTGDILATTKNYLDEETMFAFLSPTERPVQMLCGENDVIHVLTTNALYTFDKHLRLIKFALQSYQNSLMAFSYNDTNHSLNLNVINNVYDAKYIGETLWSISSLDGNLYKDGLLFKTFDGQATTFAISPDNKLWVLHDKTLVTILDPTKSSESVVLQTLTVGSSELQYSNDTRKRYISFLKQFDRQTNSEKYLCLIYYSDERILYFYSLNGVLQNIVYLNEVFDSLIVQKKSQDYEKFAFDSIGDFTGYEHRRIFKHSSTFKNKSQLVLRAGLQDLNKTPKTYEPFKYYTPIDDWKNESWYHICLTLRNKTYALYIDGIEKISFVLSPKYKATYNNQPSLFIGSPLGNKQGFNKEVQYVSNIFYGQISDIKFYDYAIPKEQIKFFINSTIVCEDLYWFYPTPSIQYVEQIERSYKHKLPGFKSSFFNLKLTGTNITDVATRKIIEEEIKTIVQNTKPAYADLLKIEWID